MERKSEWFFGVNFFTIILKYSKKSVFEQKFVFSLVVFLFTCGNFTLILTVLSIFLIGFFLNVFPSPFKVISRPSFFVWTKFPLFASCFFVDVRHFDFDFLFFKTFLICFLDMIFPFHSKSVLGLVFCLVNENSLYCMSRLVLICFFNSLSLLLCS